MITDRYLVSVLIPCYNAEKYVLKAITSILHQTHKNLEIWILDDGSTDNTLQKIKSFKDSRIKIVAYKTNTKKIGAVNEVLTQVNGDFICFQDADDWSDITRIEKQLNCFIQQPDLGICFTGYTIIPKRLNNSIPFRITDAELKKEFFKFNYEINSGYHPTLCATMMITKKILQETKGYHPFFTGRVAEDIYWVYTILTLSKGFTIKEQLYYYQTTPNSLTQQQHGGSNVKSAYTWCLLARIINIEQEQGINILAPNNVVALKEQELAACEEVLSKTVTKLSLLKKGYENSISFRLGHILLSPVRSIGKFIKSFNL